MEALPSGDLMEALPFGDLMEALPFGDLIEVYAEILGTGFHQAHLQNCLIEG